MGKPLWQLLAQTLKHLADILVKPRLDDSRCPVVLLLVRIPSFRDFVAECSDLARHLVQCARAAVNVAEIRLEFQRQGRYHEFGCICPGFMQNSVGCIKDSTE